MSKLLLICLLLATSAFGAAFPGILYYDFNGPYTVIAGSTTVFAFTPYLEFNYTVNASTDVFTITTSGVSLTNGDLVTAEETPGGTGWTANTLPTGMYGMVNGQRAHYAVCGLSGSTFQLKYDATITSGSQGTPTCSSPTTLNVTDTGSGTLTFAIWSRTTGDQIYLSTPTGFPASTTFTYQKPVGTSECSATANTSNGKHYSPVGSAGQDQLCVYATVPSGATPGTGTVTFKICNDTTETNCTDWTWPINVVAPPVVTYTPPGSFSTLTGKTAWEQVMVAQPCPGTSGTSLPYQASQCGSGSNYTTYSGPANNCYPSAGGFPTGNLTAGTAFGVSYYGWNLLFDNMAIYTGTTTYRSVCFAIGMGHASGSSTLSGAIDSSVTTFSVDSGAGFENFAELQLQAERIYCTTLTGNTFSGCNRGVTGGGAAASHADATAVTSVGSSVKQYVTTNGGNMIGYAHFTESLFRAARVFNDSTYQAAGLLMQNNYIISVGPKPSVSLLRENSYGLDDAVALYKYGAVNKPHWANLRDFMYSFVLRSTEADSTNTRFPQQGYILVGLGIHALIADWQISNDNRILFVVKRALDYLWDHYDQATHAYMNLEGPDISPWCANVFSGSGAPYTFFTNGDGNCGTHPLNYQSLQMMLVQAFYWYYAMTGDTTYRDEGDDMFNNAFNQGGLTGKAASEAYYNSFNAVGWRTGTLSPYAWFGDVAVGSASSRIVGNSRISGTSRR